MSLAGEDRAYVHPIAVRLRESGVRVFYDDFEKGMMWGEDLFVFLDEVFRKKARYALVFVSRHYVEKHWPTHEGKSAQARALIADSPYFLPVRLDDSELPGLRPTIGYIDARITGRDKLIDLILEKVGVSRPIDRVPRTPEEEAFLLSARPGGWEYLLFAAVLRREMEALEPKWRDHELRYRQPQGRAIDDDAAQQLMSRMFAEVQAIVGNVERLLSPDAQISAFGAPGEAGDSTRITHLAERVIDVYRGMLEWSARVRSVTVPERYERVFEIASMFVDLPLRQFRGFVDQIVTEFDLVPEAIRTDTPLSVTLTLVVEIDEKVEEQFANELERLKDSF